MPGSSLSHERTVRIRGDGVAAYCCAYLLSQSGFQIDWQPVDRPRLPVILLGDQGLALIRDIFNQPKLFADAPRIRKRTVAWGPAAWGNATTPSALEHSAIVVSEQILLDAIRPPTTSPSSLDAQWTIVAAKPLPPPALEHCFGTRLASAVPVKLKESSDSDACWIESLEEGWLFLTPGWLLAVGGTPDKLLGKSRIVSAQIADCGLALSQFPAYPRISAPLCASDWLACGTAALAFDPICGDGTAHAIREAILASAVIRALAAGGACDDLLAHYEARLTAGFERHLTLCRQFYASGGTGAGTGNFWRSELEALDRGIQWCHAALANRPGFRYQLRGFELEAVR